MGDTAFRIIRAYTPSAFRFVMAALSMTCIFQAAVIGAAWLHGVEIPQ